MPSVSTITNNLRLPGQYYDEETGLHYNYLRYYDSTTGRYITQDLRDDYQYYAYFAVNGLTGISDIIDRVNLYNYAGNNPLFYTDPLGLFKKKNDSVQLPNQHIVDKLMCIEKKLGITLTLTEGRRPEDATYGAKNSLHKKGEAADISGLDLTVGQCRLELAALDCGFTCICRHKTLKHFHLDTRKSKCNCSNWREEGVVVYYDPCSKCERILLPLLFGW